MLEPLPLSSYPLPVLPPTPSCTLCHLHTTASHIGIPLHRSPLSLPPSPSTPALLCIGQNPGYHEDKSGIPFIGPSGSLLHSVYLRGIHAFSLATIYFTNAARCGPDPSPPTRCFKRCSPALISDILHIAPLHSSPLFILTLGAPATTHTWSKLDPSPTTPTSMSLTESFHHQAFPSSIRSHPVLLFSTFHPSFVLRSHSQIHAVQGHLQILLDHLTQSAPRPSKPTIVPTRSPITPPTR